MLSNLQRDTYQRSLGAQGAAIELADRLAQAGLAPEYAAVVQAFVDECRDDFEDASAVLHADARQNLPGPTITVDFAAAYEAQRRNIQHPIAS